MFQKSMPRLIPKEPKQLLMKVFVSTDIRTYPSAQLNSDIDSWLHVTWL